MDQRTEGRGLRRRRGVPGHGGLIVGVLRVAKPPRAPEPA